MSKRNNNRVYRKIWESHYGPIPKDKQGRSLEIHHINGNHNDNRIENLKLVTIKEHYDIHYSQKDYAACHFIAKRMAKDPEELSKIISELNKKRVGKLNPFYGKTHSEKTKKIISEKLTGENHPYWGKKRPEVGKKISSALKGKTRSDSHCKNLSIALKGNVCKQFKWKLLKDNKIIVITNLKKFCRDQNIKPFSTFNGGKEINGFRKIGRA